MARTVQKSNGTLTKDFSGLTYQNVNNGHSISLLLPNCFVARNQMHVNYLGYLSQVSAFLMSQSNCFQPTYHVHVIIHGDVNHGPAPTLPMQ